MPIGRNLACLWRLDNTPSEKLEGTAESLYHLASPVISKHYFLSLDEFHWINEDGCLSIAELSARLSVLWLQELPEPLPLLNL
jgi:hypothetical protein